MASIDSSAPETTSDSSPTLSRRPLRGGWAPTSWGRGQDSDSISSSSSDSLGSSSSSGSRRASASGGARTKTVEVGRSVGRNTISPNLSHPQSYIPSVIQPFSQTSLALVLLNLPGHPFQRNPIPVPTPLPPLGTRAAAPRVMLPMYPISRQRQLHTSTSSWRRQC